MNVNAMDVRDETGFRPGWGGKMNEQFTQNPSNDGERRLSPSTGRIIHGGKRGPQKGFSLIELMIAMAVGLLIIAGVSNMFGGVLRGDADMLASMRLNSDLSSAMTLMTSEIRRAGFCVSRGGDDCWEQDGSDANSMINLVDTDSDGRADCILYSYDRDDNGTIEGTERGGFDLAGGTLRMRRSCNADPDNATQVQACSTVCDNDLDTWEAMLDPNDFTVDTLTMTTDGSRCIHNGTQSYWYIEDGSQSIKFPCRQWIADPTDAAVNGDGDSLAIFYLSDLDDPAAGYQAKEASFNKNLTGTDGSTANLSSGMWTSPTTDSDGNPIALNDRLRDEKEYNGTLEARRINIRITATMNISDGSAMTKTLESSVKVRNEQVNTECPSGTCP